MSRWDAFCNVWVFIGMIAGGRWKPTKRERRLIAEQCERQRLGFLL